MPSSRASIKSVIGLFLFLTLPTMLRGALLTSRDAAVLVQSAPPLIRSRAAGHCPVVHLLRASGEEAFFQAREACNVVGSGLIGNFTVRLDTGGVSDSATDEAYDSERLRQLFKYFQEARTKSMLSLEQVSCLVRLTPAAVALSGNCPTISSRVSNDDAIAEVAIRPTCNVKTARETTQRYTVDRIRGLIYDAFGDLIDNEEIARLRAMLLDANGALYEFSRADAGKLLEYCPEVLHAKQTGAVVSIRANSDLDAADAYWFDISTSANAGTSSEVLDSVLINARTGTITNVRTTAIIESPELDQVRRELISAVEARKANARSRVANTCSQLSTTTKP